jgi:hypothetical protein
MIVFHLAPQLIQYHDIGCSVPRSAILLSDSVKIPFGLIIYLAEVVRCYHVFLEQLLGTGHGVGPGSCHGANLIFTESLVFQFDRLFRAPANRPDVRR